MSSVVYKANLYLFAKGIGDGSEYHRTFNVSTWRGWSKLLGTTDVAMNASVHNANLYLFAKGINDAVIYAQSFDGFN